MCSQWRCMAFNLTTKLEGKWFSNIQNTLHMSCIYYAVKFMKLVCNDMFERGNGSKQLWYSTMKRIWGEHVNNDEVSMNFAINQSRPNIPSVRSPHGEKMNTTKNALHPVKMDGKIEIHQKLVLEIRQFLTSWSVKREKCFAQLSELKKFTLQ